MQKGQYAGPLEQIDANSWRIPKSYRADMLVDGVVFANDTLMELLRKDQALDQVANVATLPGIQGASLAMPDIHWGYGFCIGGVCATDPAEGASSRPAASATTSIAACGSSRPTCFWMMSSRTCALLSRRLFDNVPTGVGKSGQVQVRREGDAQTDGRGRPASPPTASLGTPDDLAHIEANGKIDGGDPEDVSDHAVKRGSSQCGTLGSGNHFLEVQVVDQIVDAGGRQGVRAGVESGLRHDSLRQPRAGLPGV